jgi:hypothetical protein
MEIKSLLSKIKHLHENDSHFGHGKLKISEYTCHS